MKTIFYTLLVSTIINVALKLTGVIDMLPWAIVLIPAILLLFFIVLLYLLSAAISIESNHETQEKRIYDAISKQYEQSTYRKFNAHSTNVHISKSIIHNKN